MLIAFVLSVPVFLLRNTFSYWFTDSAEVCVLVSQTVIPLIVYQLATAFSTPLPTPCAAFRACVRSSG